MLVLQRAVRILVVGEHVSQVTTKLGDQDRDLGGRVWYYSTMQTIPIDMAL